MSRHWTLPTDATDPAMALPLPQVTELLRKLGLAGRDAVAEDLLHLVGARVPLAQCTIFSYQGQGRPRIVAVGDRARTRALPRISQDYVSRFYRLDGSVQVMHAEFEAARRASAAQPHILLHLQRGDDIAHREYREVCYELPQVVERLAILALYEGSQWLSVNFYRGLEHGPFDEQAIAVVQAFAPLIVQAVRLHYAGWQTHHEMAALLLARLQRQFPELSKRDLDVVAGLLAGRTTEDLADHMGIALSSAQTYLKRVYRKLGISGQRELLGLLVGPSA